MPIPADQRIYDLIRRVGSNIRQDDIDEIRALLTQVPFEQYDDVAGCVWEAVWQVVNDSGYKGTAHPPIN